jgi:ligand-binding SRPBCC domain-containing protein
LHFIQKIDDVHEITINAPLEKVWSVLSNVEALEQFDPTVRKSNAVSTIRNGIGAKRKVDMADGKNWFEEVVTTSIQNEALTYELTACSFPIHSLKHSYSFVSNGTQTTVRQVMEYRVKYGLLGQLLDKLMIRKQTSGGVKKFFAGLKSYLEK